MQKEYPDYPGTRADIRSNFPQIGCPDNPDIVLTSFALH
jgi:hypothetical protein